MTESLTQTTAESPWGPITFTLTSDREGHAAADDLVVNGIACTLEYLSFARNDDGTVWYPRGGSCGGLFRKEGFRESATDNARRKVCNWVFEQAASLFNDPEMRAAGHTSEIVSYLTRAQSYVTQYREKLAKAEARLAEVTQQAALGTPFCYKECRPHLYPCRRPQGHQGLCDDLQSTTR